MHSIWSKPDVVYYILAFVPEKSLPSLAQTASVFFEAAVSYIWRTVNVTGLDSLLAMILRRPDTSDSEYAQPNWPRFDIYRNRVRHLKLHLLDGEPEDESLPINESLQYIRLLRPNITPFPVLQSVYICPFCPEDFPILDWVLTDSLQRVEIAYLDLTDPQETNMRKWNLLCFAFFNELSKQVPDLIALNISEFDPPIIFRTILFQVIPVFSQLRVFRATSVMATPAMLEILSDLPHLRDISFRQCIAGPVQSTPVPPSAGSKASRYLALRVVSVEGSVSFVSAILSDMRGAGIENLDIITADDHPSPSEMTKFCALISSYSSTLAELDLQIFDPSNSPREAPFTWAEFQPLAICHKIKVFEFALHCSTPAYLQDKDADALAHAWPLLQAITVKFRSNRRGGPTATYSDAFGIRGLHALAVQCPRLRKMSFSTVCITRDSPLPLFSPNRISDHPVYLQVDEPSSPANADRIAASLDGLWASLVTEGDADCKGEALWESVDSHLSAIQMARGDKHRLWMLE